MGWKQLLRREWLWLAGLLLLVSLHFWFPRLSSGPHDSYSTMALGKKGLVLLAEARGFSVERSNRPLRGWSGDDYPGSSQMAVNRSASVLCLLGPSRYPTSDEWKALRSWVSQGGSLIFAIREDEFFDKPTDSVIDLSNQIGFPVRFASSLLSLGGIDVDMPELELRNALIPEGDLLWSTSGQLQTETGQPLVSSDGTLQATRIGYGRGTVTLVASDWIFSNQSLTYGDNGALALRLIEPTQPGARICFDESLNESGVPRVVSLLLTPEFRSGTIQLAIVVLLFCWYRNRRFGPVIEHSLLPQNNILDHTDTVGQRMYRNGAAAWAVGVYLKQLMHELKLRLYPGQEERILEPIAVRMNRPVSDLQTLLQRAEKAARSKKLDRHRATRLIGQLAQVRAAWSEMRAR